MIQAVQEVNAMNCYNHYWRFITITCIHVIIHSKRFLSSWLHSKNLKIKIYKKNAIASCEIWPLTLKEKWRLRVFESRILKRIFGTKRCENGEWRKLHNKELHTLYRSPNIVRVIKSRRLRWAGNVARMEEGRSAFKISTGKPIG